ncbi:angiopoietin-4 [Biomphalaria glabrata]|nr:angiopoietin-4 [Biomphalaria glabrata]
MEEARAHRYSMKNPKKGIVLIFNNTNFHSSSLPTRHGSDADEESMRKLFRVMDFEADDIRIRRDVSVNEMKRELAEVSRLDHTDYNCLVCFILSHGEDGYVHGTDGKMAVTDITSFFQGNRCPTLNGKPKLFFVQACRGTKFDEGVDYVDSCVPDQVQENLGFAIPQYEPDFLIAYSSVQGYFSWRNNAKGSYFIQAIQEVFSNYWGEFNLQKLMTGVNWVMATRFESKSSNDFMRYKKQMPCFLSTLTKDLYF